MLLIIAMGAKGFLEFFSLAKYRVLLTADQKTYVVSLSSAIYIVINTLIIATFAMLKFNIILIYFLAITSLFVRSIILTAYVKSKYKNISYNEEPDTKALNKRWSALFLQILGSIQNGAATILATIFTTLIMVSVFSVYNMVMLGINSLLSIFTSGLSSSFGDIIAQKEEQILKKAYSDFEFVYYALISVVYGVSFVMFIPFIKLYTEGFTDANYILPLTAFLIVLNGLLYNIKTPQGMLVISAGLYRETIRPTTIQALSLIVFGSIFGYFWGINGILIGSCISNLYRTIDLLFYIPKNVTKLPVSSTLKRMIVTLFQVFLISLPSLLLPIQCQNYLVWIAYSLVYCIYAVVVVCFISMILNRNQVFSVVNRIKRGLAKKL